MDEKNMMGNRPGMEGGEHYHNGNKCMLCHGGHCEKCGTCSHCGGMCPYCGGRHMLLRWIIGIAILIAVFCLGVKLGELKSSMYYGDYSGGRGHYMMWGADNGSGVYVYGPGMMGSWGAVPKTTSTK